MQIKPISKNTEIEARRYLDALAMPIGSLGKLEDLAVQLSGISGTIHPKLQHFQIMVFCADNGIVEEGVSSAPKTITAKQAVNMTHYKTGMACMAHHFHDDVKVIDVGIASVYQCKEIINKKITKGTNNFLKKPAMTQDQVCQAIQVGIDMAMESDADAIGVGEMGIGNTTTASAVLAALTHASVDRITGRGGGLSDVALIHKKAVIKQALKQYVWKDNDVIDILSKVGGLDIAAMCGCFIGCAKKQIPAVIDGYISIVAALCAQYLCPHTKEYCIPSHISVEPGYTWAQNELGMHPYFDLGMRLGEGSGCVFTFRLIEAACAIMNDMATFKAAEINDRYLDEIREHKEYQE